MPFCRECGKEVQEDWVTCPYCSASTAGKEYVPKTKIQLEKEKHIKILNNHVETLHRNNEPTVSGKTFFLVIGILCLMIVAYSYSSYSNSVCGTFMSVFAADECSVWNAFNLICGGIGILAIFLGLRK